LRVTGARSVWEQKVGEVLNEHVSSGGGERVRAVHRHLIFDANRDDVACGYSLEVHLEMGRHHTKSLLDAQVQGAVHALGDMLVEGAQATLQRGPGLRLAFFNLLADLEGGGPQLLHLLL
jgi:hypothetical protein